MRVRMRAVSYIGSLSAPTGYWLVKDALDKVRATVDASKSWEKLHPEVYIVHGGNAQKFWPLGPTGTDDLQRSNIGVPSRGSGA